MKKFSYLGIASMAIALAACSNEDVMVGNQTPQAGFTLKAYVDNGGSRATAERDEEAQKHNFKWQTGDKIAVVANSNTIIMTLKDGDGGGTNSASFSADEEAAYVTTAIYPYNENEPSTYENNEWTVRLPKSYSYAGAYDGNINCPMLATVEGDDVDAQSLSFKHLGAAMRFDLLELPSEANEVALTIVGKKINGDFTIVDGQIVTKGSNDDSEQSVSIKWNQGSEVAQSEAQPSVFFFPVPVGQYTDIKLQVKNGDNVLNTIEVSNTYDINRSDMGIIPVITVGGTLAGLEETIANGGSFTLGSDMTLSEEKLIETTTPVVIDLNGYTLSGTITSQGDLTIKDSSAEGKGVFAGKVRANFTGDKEDRGNGKSGKVTLESGTINGYVVVGISGEFVMNGGTVTNSSMCVSANNMNNSPDNAKSKITINGGTVTSQNESAIFVPDNTEVLIEPKDGKDVNISGLRSAIAIDKGNLTIKGGTFETRFTTETILPGTSGTNGFPLAVIAAPCYYGNVSVSVEGGTFKGVSGISTAKVGDRVEQGSDYTTTVSVTGGDWQDPEIFGYAGANAKINVTMSADREIKEAIRIANGTVASIDFNGFTITNRTEISGGKYPSSHGFLINGNGTEVTFNNTASTSGGIKIDGSGSDNDAYRQAMIISDNAKVTINGGKFYNVQKQITQLDLIQVSLGGNDDKASLTINGGEFESGCYSTYSNKIRYWVLNILNESKDTSSIKVNGGSFVNFNPARPEMDDQDTYLGEGKTVVVEGSENIDVDKPYYEVISDKNNPQRLVYTVK